MSELSDDVDGITAKTPEELLDYIKLTMPFILRNMKRNQCYKSTIELVEAAVAVFEEQHITITSGIRCGNQTTLLEDNISFLVRMHNMLGAAAELPLGSGNISRRGLESMVVGVRVFLAREAAAISEAKLGAEAQEEVRRANLASEIADADTEAKAKAEAEAKAKAEAEAEALATHAKNAEEALDYLVQGAYWLNRQEKDSDSDAEDSDSDAVLYNAIESYYLNPPQTHTGSESEELDAVLDNVFKSYKWYTPPTHTGHCNSIQDHRPPPIENQGLWNVVEYVFRLFYPKW